MPQLEKDPFDLRIRNLNIKRGTITHEDVQEYLKSLPDDSEWAEAHQVYEDEYALPESETLEKPLTAEEADEEDKNT